MLWILPFLATNYVLPILSLQQQEEKSPSVEQQLNEIHDNRNYYVWPKFPEPIDFPKPAPEQWDRPNKPAYSKAAELLRSSLNQSVDPCDDFYEFTCGRWLANNPLPAGQKRNAVFTQAKNKTKHLLYGLFEDPKPSSSRAINIVKSVFNACMNYDRKKPSALLERINELCGWPILLGSDWNPKCFNLPHVLAKIKRSLGLSTVFLEPVIKENRFNASQQMIYFYQTGLGLWTPEDYRNEIKLEEYSQRITQMVKVLASDAGIEFCDTKISNEVNKIVNFERQLANITIHYKTYVEKNAAFKFRRYSNLTKIIPELLEYFKALLPIKESLHKYFASDPEVFVTDFPERLSQLLRKTDKITLANYVILRFVMEWSNIQLDDRLESKKEKATSEAQIIKCVEQVVDNMPYASGAMYVRKYFGKESKNAVSEMVGDIRNAFRKMLSQNTWMDPVTKKRAISKLDKVIPQIGFPEFLLNDTALDAYYDELKFGGNESYSSMLEKIYTFNTEKDFLKLLALTDRNEFDTPVYSTNAFFYPTRNNIYIPAGSLQAPFYDKSFPKAMNYGGVGYIISHEFTHGFDDEIGSKNDEIGNEICWWEPKTKANFVKQKQCLIDEYNSYRMPELNMTVDGTKTESENIADNGGIKEAYMAYQTYYKKLGQEEKRIPGFEQFTNEQLFFISNGLIWCGKLSEDALKWQLSVSGHSPNRYRVNGPLPNLPEFAAAFNCPKGSPMNPEKKCRVW